MPSIGLNLRVTTDSKQGGRVYMEDVLRVGFEKGLDGKEVEFGYFAVFDGHGGAEAAQFARDHLLNEIRKTKGFWSDDDDQVLKAIKLAFINTHKLMWNAHMSWARTSSGYPSTSGTTSSVVIIRNKTLYVAHVGDSAVVLGTMGENGRLRADCLTDEHKPNAPKEMARIRESGGAVMAKAGVNRVVWQRPKKPLHGPIRRSTLVEKIPFLAVARSLGDLWSYNFQKDVFVVSPEPDVVSLKLDPRVHKCLVIASDGLWNVIKPQSSVDLTHELEQRAEDGEGPKEKPASLLVKLALRRWDSLFYRADNTSVIVVMIDPPGPSTAKTARTQSSSTSSTLKLGSESDAEDTSESDVTGSDCDIDLDDGEADDLSLSYEVGKIFPRLCADDVNRGRAGKAAAASGGTRALSEHCLRCVHRATSLPSTLPPRSPRSPCPHQGKSGVKSVCSPNKDPSCTSQQGTQTATLQNTSATSNILMEAALNAPPFLEPATRVMSPQQHVLRSPQKTTLLGSHSGDAGNSDAGSRTLRPRSPRQAGENLPVGSTSPLPLPSPPALSRQGARYSMSPSSSFISHDPRSPLEATSVRSPLKVDAVSKSTSLPLATMSPLWPLQLELGAEVEVEELLAASRLAGRSTAGQSRSASTAGQASSGAGDSAATGEDAQGGVENVEHPRRGRPASRQCPGLKRRASSSPASLTAKRHHGLPARRLRLPQSQPNTRAHLKSPTKKTKA